ncbi:unnamed protein product [Blepharisma stoltei]|uniref:DOMON domain-containing protein n=1 Tax=Blepharisma stoltei TaxID=1481888 RepID=A0AAU9JTI7_9CILI|nr:unnamed protein product [Blepharisma stoltei]
MQNNKNIINMFNYKNIYLLFSSIIFSTYGFALFDEIELTWTFPTDEQISFKLSVPLSILEEDEYNWAFIGFKPTVLNPMANGTDIVLVNFTANTIEDRISEMHFPLLDKDLGGADDLILKSIEIDGDSKSYLWSRGFTSLDLRDVNFIAGKQYNLIWACGGYYQNSKPKIIKSGNTILSINNGRRLRRKLQQKWSAQIFFKIRHWIW